MARLYRVDWGVAEHGLALPRALEGSRAWLGSTAWIGEQPSVARLYRMPVPVPGNGIRDCLGTALW